MPLSPNVAQDVKNKIKNMEAQLLQWEKDIELMEKARIPTLAMRADYNTTRERIQALKSAYG